MSDDGVAGAGLLTERQADDVARFPLPDGVDDAVLNKTQLARALDASEPTIDRWIADGMPVLQEGSNGRSYQFQLSHCYAWRKARLAERQAVDEKAERAVRQMRMALVGGSVGDSERGLHPKERAAIYEAEQRWTEMARARGELVPYGEVVEVFDKLLSLVRAAVDGMPDRVKRDADLSPAQLHAVVQVGDDIIDDLGRQVDAWLEETDAKRRSPVREGLAA